MINSRDSYSEFNPNKKESIEVPYAIGTIVELKENPNVLAKICQYRIDYRRIINVGLSLDIYSKNTETNYEITNEDLEKNWKKTDRIIFGKLDWKNFIKMEITAEKPMFKVLTKENKSSS